jgi:hypothetical protein
MDRTGTQASFWLLCLLYVVFRLNYLASDALGGLTPIEIATAERPDISALLQFRWFEPVLYSVDHSFASDSPEKSGRWVGVAENKGDALTYLILTDDTNKVITHSAVRTALDPTNPNLRARPNPGFSQATSDGTTSSPSSGDGESPSTPILFSALDLSGLNIDLPDLKLPHFSPDDLGTHYEFVCVYVDDLACIMAYPHLFFQELRHRGYKLKGAGEITYHLGGDFFRDPDGTLAWGAKKYIKRVVNQRDPAHKGRRVGKN